jgi:hypothetical protein
MKRRLRSVFHFSTFEKDGIVRYDHQVARLSHLEFKLLEKNDPVNRFGPVPWRAREATTLRRTFLEK